MCGTVRHEGRAKMIGAKVVTTLDGGQLTIGRWTGFARMENLNTVWRGRLNLGVMKADDYIEKGHIFTVPTGMGIRIGVITKEIEILGQSVTSWNAQYAPGNILIITRPAIIPVERSIHDRHPVFTKLA